MPKTASTKKRPPLILSSFQAVTRDLAFVVNIDTPAADVARAAQRADKQLITRVEVFDTFEGDSLGKKKKSVALQVTLQPQQQTFTDKEIDIITDKIIFFVNKQTGAVLRS